MKRVLAILILGVSLSACVTEKFCPADLTPKLQPHYLSLTPGHTKQASYKLYGCGGTQELETTSEWTSENPEIASVSDTGFITAVSVGNTRIKGTLYSAEIQHTEEDFVNLTVEAAE